MCVYVWVHVQIYACMCVFECVQSNITRFTVNWARWELPGKMEDPLIIVNPLMTSISLNPLSKRSCRYFHQGSLTEGKSSVRLTSLYKIAYIWPHCTNLSIPPAFVISNIIYFFTKQVSLMRRSTVLSLSHSVSVPCFHLHFLPLINLFKMVRPKDMKIC